MSVSPNSSPRIARKQQLGDRLRQIRSELYGEAGAEGLAGLLGIPPRTWANYENGVTMPGEILLVFLVRTGVEPLWLLDGEGPKIRNFPGTAATPGP